MNQRKQHLQLMNSLLYSISYSEQDPEAFKLFFGVYWKDMIPASEEWAEANRESRIYFPAVLCHDGEVLSVALPARRSGDKLGLPLPPSVLDSLREMGVPLFSDLLEERRDADGVLRERLKSQGCPPPSGWRFPTVRVSPELGRLLDAKGMVDGNGPGQRPSPVPSAYGSTLGLLRAQWLKKDLSETAGLYASAAGWAGRVRLGEHPWGGSPDWVRLPLEVRLERMKAGRAGSPGHCTSALLRLEAMPVAPVLSQSLNSRFIQQNRALLEETYASNKTYGQAARETDQLLHSNLKSERERGKDRFVDLISIFSSAYRIRQGKTEPQTKEMIRPADQDPPGGRSLSARLARQGIFEDGGTGLPLAGESLENLFQGLSRLAGTDALELKFSREILPDIQQELGEKWDGSLDGPVDTVWSSARVSAMPDINLESKAVKALRLLLLEPFLLLEKVRDLEKKNRGLLEEIQIQNKALKTELERMSIHGPDGGK